MEEVNSRRTELWEGLMSDTLEGSPSLVVFAELPIYVLPRCWQPCFLGSSVFPPSRASFFGEVGGVIAWEDSPGPGTGRDLGVGERIEEVFVLGTEERNLEAKMSRGDCPGLKLFSVPATLGMKERGLSCLSC